MFLLLEIYNNVMTPRVRSPLSVQTFGYADLFSRIIGYLIDCLLIYLIYGLVMGTLYPNWDISPQLLWWHFWIQWGIFLAYFFLCTWLWHGHSLGQKILKLQVVQYVAFSTNQSKREQPSPLAIFLHVITKFPLILLIDLLLGLLFRSRYKREDIPRLMQIWARTSVIRPLDAFES